MITYVHRHKTLNVHFMPLTLFHLNPHIVHTVLGSQPLLCALGANLSALSANLSALSALSANLSAKQLSALSAHLGT